MSESIMTQAAELMIVGMGFVFVFLTVLVFATKGMSKVAVKLAPPVPPKPAPARAAASPTQPGMDDATLMAVISAAVNKYRSEHKK